MQEITCKLRIKIEETGLYTYPDVSVVCPPIRFDGARRDTVLNPSVIVEVLSPSSNYYDRGKKFQHYRTIESLTAYLLVAQDMQCVELYERLPNDRWLISRSYSSEQQIQLPGIDCVMPLAAIYEGVVFEEEEPEG